MKYLILFLSLSLMISARAQAADTPGGPPPAKVVVGAVMEKMVAENTPIVGTLYFDRVSRVSTDVSGLVQAIPFREGDRVSRGDILLKLNTDFIEKDIELALTRIERLDVEIEKVDKDLERFEALYRENAATEKAYDDLRFTRRELCKQRESLVKELEIARLKKAKSAVQAPFDAIVLEKHAEVGNWVSPGAVFCHLGALDELCIRVPLAEELMTYSREGDKIPVTLTAFQKKVTGTVAGFLPVADLKTKNVMMKIMLPRIPGIIENMSATVIVPTGRPRRLTLVPRSAVVNLQGRDFLFTVKEGKASPVPIRIVAFLDEFAGVDGPSVVRGMPVILDGGERLRPGQPVESVNDGQSPGAPGGQEREEKAD